MNATRGAVTERLWLAITGGIAEGKSTVLSVLRERGLRVASADSLAREVFASTKVQAFLAGWLGVPSPVDPALVRERLSGDPRFRRALNRMMHPPILAAMRECGAQAIEVPLLLESCIQREFQRIWVVTCGPDEQLERLTHRLGSREAAAALIRAQLPTPVKLAFADQVVWSGGPRAATESRVRELLDFELA